MERKPQKPTFLEYYDANKTALQQKGLLWWRQYITEFFGTDEVVLLDAAQHYQACSGTASSTRRMEQLSKRTEDYVRTSQDNRTLPPGRSGPPGLYPIQSNLAAFQKFNDYLAGQQVNLGQLSVTLVTYLWFEYIVTMQEALTDFRLIIELFKAPPKSSVQSASQLGNKMISCSGQMKFALDQYFEGCTGLANITWGNGALSPAECCPRSTCGINTQADIAECNVTLVVLAGADCFQSAFDGKVTADSLQGPTKHAEYKWFNSKMGECKERLTAIQQGKLVPLIQQAALKPKPKKLSCTVRLEFFVSYECCDSCVTMMTTRLLPALITLAKGVSNDVDWNGEIRAWCFRPYEAPTSGNPCRFFIIDKAGSRRVYIAPRHVFELKGAADAAIEGRK